MKLMEWADLKKLYKRSCKRPNKLLFKWKNARRLWPMWASVMSTIPLIVLVGFGSVRPELIPYTAIALAPWAVALYITRFKALRTVYPSQFAVHAIDRQSWLEKENILCYAFFLEMVRKRGYTAEKLRELSSYSDLTVKPPRPPLSQDIIFASLIAFMIAISTEVIKATPFFKLGQGSVVLMLVFVSLVIYRLLWDGIHSKSYEKDWIKRYLNLAAYDIEESVRAAEREAFEDPSMENCPVLLQDDPDAGVVQISHSPVYET